MSLSHTPLQSLADITCITPEPFIPKPLIADILRTRYCILGSIFLVEGIDFFLASKSKRWRAIRLLLGDGELCIQALLAGEMHRYVDGGEVTIGSYVKVEGFRLAYGGSEGQVSVKGKEKEYDTASEMGNMVYLVVEGLVVVGWNNRLLEMADNAEPSLTIENESEQESRGAEDDPKDPKANVTALLAMPAAPETRNLDADLLEELADAVDDFEVMDMLEDKTRHTGARVAPPVMSAPRNSASVASNNLPWVSDDLTKPLKLTPLRSIPNLPYKQNWSTNVLAVIASISGLDSSTLPPFSQRVARLAHPSTTKHVHLTVFLDPQEFAPSVGSVVLLLGVKNHRFDGGSLKKYASDRPRGGGSWWYENPRQFTWCDVERLKKWWDHREL